jgi:S-adenosylmethionine decarboxylase
MERMGRHLILDIWGAVGALPFWNMDEAAEALKKAAAVAGTTFMTERWHHFGDGHGYTGVIVLAESHVSVHTWPELGYAAIDAFYCGECNPMDSLQTILDFYKPHRNNFSLIERGN